MRYTVEEARTFSKEEPFSEKSLQKFEVFKKRDESMLLGDRYTSIMRFSVDCLNWFATSSAADSR